MKLKFGNPSVLLSESCTRKTTHGEITLLITLWPEMQTHNSEASYVKSHIHKYTRMYQQVPNLSVKFHDFKSKPDSAES